MGGLWRVLCGESLAACAQERQDGGRQWLSVSIHTLALVSARRPVLSATYDYLDRNKQSQKAFHVITPTSTIDYFTSKRTNEIYMYSM